MMQDGFTPLLISSQNGHDGVVEVLLKNSANIEAADKVRVRGSCMVVGVQEDDCCTDDVCSCLCVCNVLWL